jgi:hypothetical protein
MPPFFTAIVALPSHILCLHLSLYSVAAHQALLKRLDARLAVRGNTSDGVQSLLRQLSPSAPKGRKLERYPVRVMLCAYMIQAHPEVVFNKVVSGKQVEVAVCGCGTCACVHLWT